MRKQVLAIVGVLGLVSGDAFAQSSNGSEGPCLFFDGSPPTGFSGAMEGGPGTVVPGPVPNAAVTNSGQTEGFRSSSCSTTAGLLSIGMTELGGRRSRARIQNTDGPPDGGGN